MYQKFNKFAWLLMFIQVFALQMAMADDVKDRNAVRVELEQLVLSGVPSNSDVSIASVNLLLEITRSVIICRPGTISGRSGSCLRQSRRRRLTGWIRLTII